MMFLSWSMQDELILLVICGLTAIAGISSVAYRTVPKEEQIISSRAKLRYLLVLFPIFLLIAKTVSYLTSDNPLFFTIVLFGVAIVYALLQYFSVGIGIVLISWTIWLPGIAATIIYFETTLAHTSTLISGLGSIHSVNPAAMTALSTIGAGLLSMPVLVFLGAIAFFGVEANVLWQQTHYSIRSKRILTLAMALGLVFFTVMFIRWIAYPLSAMLADLVKLLSS